MGAGDNSSRGPECTVVLRGGVDRFTRLLAGSFFLLHPPFGQSPGTFSRTSLNGVREEFDVGRIALRAADSTDKWIAGLKRG